MGRDARNLQIGHSYLLQGGRPVKDMTALRRALRDDILPMLEEYCYEDFTALQNILGNGLLDAEKRRIRNELFEDDQEATLVQALMEPCPEVVTTAEAISTHEQEEPVAEDDESDDGPPFQWLQNWKTLVRQPGDNPLTIPCVLVYSLIRHSHENKWKPAQGWTHEYLATLTATNPKTVPAALGTLEENGFLKVLDGMRFGFYRLRDSQLACFADRKAWSGNSAEPDEFIDEFGPGSDRLDKRHKAKADLDEYLVRWPIPGDAKARIRAAIVKQEGWEEKWRDWAFDLVGKFLQ